MTGKKCEAVMLCTVKEPAKVIDLGINVLKLLFGNPADYATPPRNVAYLLKLVGDASAAQALVKKGGTIATSDRDDKVLLLFTCLEDEFLPYVNGLFKGNRTKLLLSGFPVSAVGEPHPLPKKMVIRKIVKGPEPHSAKVLLENEKNPNKSKKEKLIYKLYQYDTPDVPDSGKLILTNSNRYKLFGKNLTRGKEVGFEVTASNAAGTSESSGIVKYMPD